MAVSPAVLLNARLISRPLHDPQRPCQQPRRLTPLHIGLQPPELHRRVFQRLGRARVDLPVQLGDLVQQVVDPLAGLGTTKTALTALASYKQTFFVRGCQDRS